MKFDNIIITAANAAQANGYRAQLKGRENFSVIPDPGDKRVGSLGATVNALKVLEPKGLTLICHSGGDARRTPAYAAMGKAFVPLKDKRTMLDHIIEAMERLTLPKSGVLICCGDVIPYLDYESVKISKSGVTGVAYPDGPWQAQRHGVYFEENGKVTKFLQKPKVEEGSFLIDTGIMFIDSKTAKKMEALPIAGDIYEEFPKMLLEGFADFSVSVVPTCEFFHIGSSRELLKFLGSDGKLVDSCAVKNLTLEGDNIVTNVPKTYAESIHLKKGECLTCLPVGKSQWVELKYHIDDNFKSDGKWEANNLGVIMPKVNHERLLKLRERPKRVKVVAPVRIDFAGGWSDTPPICNLEGGTVLNMAVDLEGRRPIEVTVSERKDSFIKIVSKDLGKRRLIKSAAEVADHSDPHDWCALVKSALTVTGFKFGSRGIDITISADLPKGSGMGTSSILGAATIAAILGEVDVAKVAALTLELEREMHTGGGWQDQFGGLLGGIKLLRSVPGDEQKVDVEMIVAHENFISAFKSRALLYFTGQKRMARNILRKVLGFYKENPHGFAKILVDSLKKDAEAAALAIRAGDIEAFARSINNYWRDKKLLDPGSTNERVEAMIEQIKDHLSAVTLTGAGGGGFMFMIAKSEEDAKAIRREFSKRPPSKWSRFYDFSIDMTGLTIV